MKIPIPPTSPPEDAAEPALVTDIGMARRAKLAETENEKLRQQVQELEALRRRHNGRGDLDADPADKGHSEYHCDARAPGGGKHPIVRVCAKDRVVECKVCGAKLDPIDVLLSFAHAERMFSYHLTSLRDEATSLQKECERLRAERSSLRSQVKRKTAKRKEEASAPPAARDEASRWAKELADSMTDKLRR